MSSGRQPSSSNASTASSPASIASSAVQSTKRTSGPSPPNSLIGIDVRGLNIRRLGPESKSEFGDEGSKKEGRGYCHRADRHILPSYVHQQRDVFAHTQAGETQNHRWDR